MPIMSACSQSNSVSQESILAISPRHSRIWHSSVLLPIWKVAARRADRSRGCRRYSIRESKRKWSNARRSFEEAPLHEVTVCVPSHAIRYNCFECQHPVTTDKVFEISTKHSSEGKRWPG